MPALHLLHQLLDESARIYPDRTAVEEPGVGSISYRELAELSDRLCASLCQIGVKKGDRVGMYMHKSIDAVASIFGILKAGAAYVPVDPNAPSARNAYILNDCSVKAVIIEDRFIEALRPELDGQTKPSYIALGGTEGGIRLKEALQLEGQDQTSMQGVSELNPSGLAYILYTSGSTGKPKGVMLTHENAISFIDWCSELMLPQPEDRFSSHAPFHFDLSILDIYVPLKHGAALVLVGEELGKDPTRLAALISESQITCWYSTPSILSLLAQYGNMQRYDYTALRIVNFAGEVFPIKHLKLLKSLLPNPRYLNLYGPTETNVCTYYELPKRIPEGQSQPFPIGKACSHYRIMVVDGQGQPVKPGKEGELCANGPGVTQGYWNLPERTASAYLIDADGQRWYRTGDIVVQNEDGDYIYISRRDRMVKKRGYRVELGEIETALYRHPAIKEAAVIALTDEEKGVQVKAFISCGDQKRASIIELKKFCMERLPPYMVPDLFSFQDSLPKTSTDKIDYQRLNEMA
jgi:amino acid adenylation domain-containing protein